MILSNFPQTGGSHFGESETQLQHQEQTVQKMIPLRYIVPAVLVAAAAAGYITHIVTPSAKVERLPSIRSDWTGLAAGAVASMDRRAGEHEQAAADYLRAAQAILKRAPNTQASFADIDHAKLVGPIPLPRRRPISRP